jgi:cytochrome c oxidase subunit 3
MTGLHGLHVLIGALIIFVVLVLVAKNRVTSSDFVAVENTGLYWHLVDMVWIYLFPLFYLVV